jgi:hypothetical protein
MMATQRNELLRRIARRKWLTPSWNRFSQEQRHMIDMLPLGEAYQPESPLEPVETILTWDRVIQWFSDWERRTRLLRKELLTSRQEALRQKHLQKRLLTTNVSKTIAY